MRVHAPNPEVVWVRLSGTLDARSASLLAERAGQQISRAPHVVLDMRDVTFLGAAGLEVLHDLDRLAAVAGTWLHVAAEHREVCRPLHISGLDQALPVSPTAETVVADIVCRRACTPARTRTPASATTTISPAKPQLAHMPGPHLPHQRRLPRMSGEIQVK